MNLLENIVTKMTPTEFEIYCLNLLKDIAKGYNNCSVSHNKLVIVNDGEYQIDGLINFEMFGVNYKTIVECKKYNSKIKRSQIQIFHDTLRNIGAHKGIFISTSSFQSGAMEYAKIHGIALLQIVNGAIMNVQMSVNINPLLIERARTPKFVAANYNLDLFCPSGFVYKDRMNLLFEYLSDITDSREIFTNP